MDIRAIAMGLAFAFIWSSAFTSARIIVAEAAPIATLAIRFLISGLIGVAIARAMGQTWNLTPNQWRATFVFGICQNAVYLGMNFVAMQTVEASLAAIIASTMPLMVAAAGWIVFRDRLTTIAILGLGLGMAGVILIMSARIEAGVDLFGVALCIVGSIALTIATLTMRQASSGGNLMMIVGLQMLIGAGVLAVIALLFEPFHLNLTPPVALAFVYTTLFPGLLATWIWFALVDRVGATRAATFHFLNPFFGVAIAAALLGEALGLRDIAGVAIITVGILCVQWSKQQKS